MQQWNEPRNLIGFGFLDRGPLVMMPVFSLFRSAVLFLAFAAATPAQVAAPEVPPQTETEKHALLDRVIEHQKKNDAALEAYERIERVETRKNSASEQTPTVKISRVVPAGAGVDHIPLGLDGRPADTEAYRAELVKLEKSLAWAVEEGRAQQDAYAKIAKKRKEREELTDTARNAFLFSFLTREPRADRVLLKYSMVPNPAFKPTSRSSSFFTRVRGAVWIDEASGQLARIEGEVTDDISVGLLLAKVYKGSHFMQERYEAAPGIWLPSFSQYDFDGRKFFSSFSLHERTFYTNYRFIGPPKEALATIRAELAHAELGKSGSTVAAP
jgi:hypothetical protein